jgi:hypothetical protein
MVSNRAAGMQFKNEVILYLHRQGLADAFDPTASKRLLSEALADKNTHTDIAGVPPWMIDVRTGLVRDISTALSDAADGARALGTDWFVTIQNRRGYPIADAYAVIPLRLMTRLFAGEVPAARAHPSNPLPGTN